MLSVDAIFANEDRQARWRSSARSTEQICAADAANKNKAVAADELFRQSAQQIHASRPHRKSQAEKGCRRSPITKRQPVMRSMATSRARRSVLIAPCETGRGHRPRLQQRVACATTQTLQYRVAERHKQSVL